MQRIWQKYYPAGVPYDIDPNTYRSVLDIFKEASQKYNNKPAYTNFGHTITFGELEQLTAQFACYLQNDLGLKKGDHLAIMLPNIIQYPVAVLSAIRLGLVVVNIDPLYTQRELTLQLKDSEAETIIVFEKFAIEVEKALPNVFVRNVIVTKLGDCLPIGKALLLNAVLKHIKKAIPNYHIDAAITMRKALTKYKKGSSLLKDANIDPDNLLFLQYTGGTTGVPKGVEITHRNMVSNILMSGEWVKPALSVGEHRIISPLPMYHIFCMSVNLMMMNMGRENILVTDPRDFVAFIKLLKNNRFTGIIAVNTLLRKLLDTPGFKDVDFSSLKVTFTGGMAITRDVARQWKEVTGSTVIQAYGLSEASPSVSSVPIIANSFDGSIGLPLPSTDIKLLDDDGNEVGCNQVGELCVKGPQVMRGYWKQPDETAKVMTHDGYLRTGDYVRIDERGYLQILDRKKDMILVSGFNVFPNEIEDVVNQHPDIVESAAIGVDDREAGQVVKLFVVSNSKSLTKTEVTAHCKENLTGYKCPKHIEFMEDLPKSHVGKVLRKELR